MGNFYIDLVLHQSRSHFYKETASVKESANLVMATESTKISLSLYPYSPRSRNRIECKRLKCILSVSHTLFISYSVLIFVYIEGSFLCLPYLSFKANLTKIIPCHLKTLLI